MSFVVRIEHPEDQLAVHRIHCAAFGRPDEADLVDRLRREGDAILSLVVIAGEQIVGHILFSRMWIDGGGDPIPAAALAPVSVLPDLQNRGIGSQLIRNGLSRLQEQGERIAIVLGHPAYYSRFGFSTGKASELNSPFPASAFMAMELSSGALRGVSGSVRYAAAFGL